MAESNFGQLHPLQDLRHQGTYAGYQLADSPGRRGPEIFHDLVSGHGTDLIAVYIYGSASLESHNYS